MKIDGGTQGAYEAYRAAAKPARGTASGAPEGSDATKVTRPQADHADISAQGRLRAQAIDAVRATPESRTALVAELRAQIKDGSYTIDEHKLASRLAQHVDIKA
ncbi:MAG: flagellar biosynthesis anti-sigma factor FlgM [Chloroflexota bacterium]|nr:flagellar biosynthesis anti-sigma factor FlgM [Chloroflexota bacterium]